MNKIITSMALTAALGAGLTAGAQAQTMLTGGGTPAIYSLSVSAPTVTPTGGQFEYSYVVTLTSNPSNVNVNSFTIGNIAGATGTAPTVTNQTVTTFVGTQPGNTASFSAQSGFFTPNDTATFNIFSSLPVPTGMVSLTSNAGVITGTSTTSATNLGTTGTVQGPGPRQTPPPVVPEAGSFALLGLGLLPLGLLAHRRIARKS